MVVDDDAQALALIKAVVEPLGYGVALFDDSKEALRHIDKQKLDAIFLDVQMPNLNGFELTQCIRRSRSNGVVPIVMITGCDDVNTMRQGFKVGVTFFLGKPLVPARLRGLMKAIHSVALRERRRYARLPLRTTVDCRTSGKRFETGCVNVSQTGMLLENSGGFGIGQDLQLEFKVPGKRDPLKPRAKIVRKEEDRIGVQFTEVRPEDLQAIQSYIEGELDL
jgi:DNA-binding response OmpR family regulator